MKTVVIYHRADFDGIFCREIARKFLGPAAELIGWHYGDPLPAIPKATEDGQAGVELYMLDLSVEGLMDYPGLVWIDHHKSAIEKYDRPGDSSQRTIKGYRIDGVAACRLAWQWFTQRGAENKPAMLPNKEQFVERFIAEPWAVRMAGEYDIWDKRDPDAELFQHGLRSEELVPTSWDLLLSNSPGSLVVRLLNQGRALQYARTHENASIIKELGFTLRWEGLTFLCCNAARYNSHLFTAGLTPEHDACFGFKWTGKDWSVSLYHAPGREQHDLSVIAVRHGGGGHRGACGFRTSQLPFLP